MLHRKIFALILVLILAVSSSAEEYTPGDVIVVLKSSSSEKVSASSLEISASEFASSFSASVKEFYPALSMKDGGAFMMIHSESFDAEELSAILRENPNVAAVSPNYKIHAAVVPNDSAYDECWGMEDINTPAAWNLSTGSDDVYVAIIDSGIDHTNPDLTDNVDVNLSYRTITGSTRDAVDDYGHGTHVAGIIGAKGNNGIGVAGINWNVKMIPVKALDKSGNGSIATVISAVNYVTGLIEQGMNIRAVNLSLETYIDLVPNHDNLVAFPLWRAFKALDNTNKAVIVVAAGNYNETVGEPSSYAHGRVPSAGCYVYPASFLGLDNMISVSALNPLGFTAYYSNTGADISAPGGDFSSLVSSAGILSTWLQSDTSCIRSDGVSLESKQGTSMAAPHVAGAAALLASVMPSYATAYQIKRCILIGDDLDVYASLRYQQDNFSTLPSVGTEGRAYDDYADYSESDYVNAGNGNSSSGCSSLSLGIIAAVTVLMLARKRMS